ncbi:hypothetical protein AB6A40_009149 [Gnathostoma spinigerum]|uniref:phosphoethanolamine N-methyltransferase n=1 Tax=Gnathostoma spinigerum TaxID=75299 RepID=A0ABD6F120_9BILA
MATSVERESFFSFWSKRSHRCDVDAMMLHHSAEKLHLLDRSDILASLPDLSGKDVVEVGAGIGRYTTALAETARHVLSTDFIESFLKKNQELNGHRGNISFQLGDAVNLRLQHSSADIVFTNWLMMYLNEMEVVQFLINALTWLRPGGYIHMRESCSESSTGVKSLT